VRLFTFNILFLWLSLDYNVSQKTAPFYFCNNFVKQSFFNNFWQTYSLINFLLQAYFILFVRQKTGYQLKIYFRLLLSRLTGMMAHWRHFANTIEPSVCGGDAALPYVKLLSPLVIIVVIIDKLIFRSHIQWTGINEQLLYMYYEHGRLTVCPRPFYCSKYVTDNK